ncbi:MG2 domain-containing protein [Okeania sp. SIO1I7]|uniref:alpha-2-macroglobulin family protein n=1 Tax=Okeania sp. SIO1I7 TaxID=2607772 RepID=UPI0025EB5C5C|nr:MG2 domain-containing protein [Okeania sp. SIO1I7]
MAFKYWKHFLLGLFLAFAIAACGFFNTSSKQAKLPMVDLIITPPLPEWIEQISPTGEAELLSQIRIRFKEPLIPLETLDSLEQQEKLKKFEIFPELPGQFRFLTPKMVGFQPAESLPKSTRVKVTLKAGLSDLKNHQLDEDLAWTFNTEPVKLTNLPTTKQQNRRPQPIDINPTLKFTSNVELDVDSIEENLKFLPAGETETLPLTVSLETLETNEEEEEVFTEEFDSSFRRWNYLFAPQVTLEKGTKYRLEFDSGIEPVKGNLPSQTPFVSEVETYSAFEFSELKFSQGGGRFVKGNPMLEFNHGVVPESAVENITIEPQPKETKNLIQAYDDYNIVSFNPWALEPDTNYTITIGANLKDKFGQVLEKPVVLNYQTGDLVGNLSVPAGLNIFPSSQDLQLNISTVNLPESEYKAAYQVVQPTDLVYAESAYPRRDRKNLLPANEKWKNYPVSGEKNQIKEVAVPLREQLGGQTGMLAYGVKARTSSYVQNGETKWQEPRFYGLVQLTNLGVFVQWFPESGIIRVNHLDNGAPVVADVEIYQSQLNAKSQPKPTACATGKTDENGLLSLSKTDLQKCMNGRRFSQAPELLVIAKEKEDWAFARTKEYSGTYGYGIYSGWDSGKAESRGTIFSDRELYQPGEKVWLTGAAYYLENGNLKQAENMDYQVTINNPDGNKTNLGTQTTNEFGTFSLEVPLDNNQSLGYYNVEAKGENGIEFYGEFRVAEFKPPNFQVDLKLNREVALINEQIVAEAESNYLFGSPVQGAKAKYYVTRQKTEFTPENWQEFDFGRQWFWPEETPTIPNNVLEKNVVLDNKGGDNQIFTVGKDLPYPMTYRIDVEVTDISNLSVADTQTFTALPSNKLIGLKSKFVADANKNFPVEVIVTDPQGKPLSGENIQLELQQMEYSSVTQVVAGSRNPKYQVEYKTVASQKVRSGNKPKTVNLTPPESGSYRIRANFANAENDITGTDIQIWATGANRVYWGGRNEDRLEIKLDKDTYKPGETATALIQSPYPEGELYFAVVRDKPLYEKIVKVTGGAPEIQFQVTEDMLPNAAVEAVLVRQGQPLAEVEPGTVENLMKVGFTPFKINLADKYLNVEVTPQRPEAQPGAMQTVELAVKNNQGQPTKGQFTVMVVNEAVLQLSGHRPPDLVETVYAEQPISTTFNDNRPEVQMEAMSSALRKGWGYGGGISSAASSTRIRTDFQSLAYYNGSVITDNKGKATVTFKMPDDLTTWRVMTVATDGNLHFGNGEATFVTTQPLMLNPVLPQFARIGDKFEGGVTVTNNTGKKGNIKIDGEVSQNILFAENSQTTQIFQTSTDSGTNAYRFPMEAKQAGEAKVQFTTDLNNLNTDGFEISLPVQSLAASESVVESGTTDSQIQIPLNITENVMPDVGGLEISMASTLIPEITAPAKAVLKKDQLPFLEPTASQLAIASNLEILGEKYQQAFVDFNPEQQAKQALEKLEKLQLPDGGFGYYPGWEKSNPYLTPYAAEAIAQAKKAFPDLVNGEMVSSLRNYLNNILADPGKDEYCSEQLCKNQVRLDVLMALSELGDTRNSFLSDIYQQREKLSQVDQIKLARYISTFPKWRKQSAEMYNEIQESVYETGRSATLNIPQTWGWMNSTTASQAQALRLFITRDAKPEILDRLLQSLLNLRRDGTWRTTYDNAEALKALVTYSNTQPAPPNFVATAKLSGKQLDADRFQGYENPNLSLNVAMDGLPKGESDLVLEKSGEGKLHYLVEYSYRLPGNQPGRYNGLRVAREIRLANETSVLQRMDLSEVASPLDVSAGQVFDIGIEVITDRSVDHVIIRDPLPAGLEAVDTSFQTATSAVKAKADSWQIGYPQIYRDRVEAYADRLNPGVYTLHYLVRSVTPGTFIWPGAEARLQYAPEEFGRSATATLVVK